MLDGVLRNQPCVVRRTACHDHDLVDLSQLCVGEAHLVEVEAAVACHSATQRVSDCLGLLRDLLEHEEVVAALLGGRGIPGDGEGLGLDRIAVEVRDNDRIAGDLHDLVLAELECLARVGNERGHIGGQEVLTLPEADHER